MDLFDPGKWKLTLAARKTAVVGQPVTFSGRLTWQTFGVPLYRVDLVTFVEGTAEPTMLAATRTRGDGMYSVSAVPEAVGKNVFYARTTVPPPNTFAPAKAEVRSPIVTVFVTSTPEQPPEWEPPPKDGEPPPEKDGVL